MAFVLDEPKQYILPREDLIDPGLRDQFIAMAKDFYQQTGIPLRVTDSFRSDEEQADVYKRKPGLAAPPGKSQHNVGGLAMALDIDQGQVPIIEKLGLLDKHRFTRPVLHKGETWHIEPVKKEEATNFVLDKMPAESTAEQRQVAPAASNFVLDDVSQVVQPEVIPSKPEDITDVTSATLAQGVEPTGEAVGRILGLPHEVTSGLLGLTGVPEHQMTDIETLMRSGEAGQVGGTPIKGQVNYPLREVMATMLDPLSYYGVEKGLGALGRAVGLRLPQPAVKGTSVFKEPEAAAADWVSQIKQAQGLPKAETPAVVKPLEKSAVISEIVAANKPTGVIPAKQTTLPPSVNLVEKYGESLSKGSIEYPMLGKWDFTNIPIRKFEKLEDVHGITGLKEDIYFRQADLATAAKEEAKAIEVASRNLEAKLPKGSGQILYDYAVSQQKGGPEALKSAGREIVTQLPPELEQVHNQLRAGYDTLINRWNQARVQAGIDPIDKVEDYTAFIRKYKEIVEVGGNPIKTDAKYFKPTKKDLPFEKSRTQSNLPLEEVDAFKLYRRYSKSVLNEIYQGPLNAEVRGLAKQIRNAAGKNTGTAQFLDSWVDQVVGKKEPLFGSTGRTPEGKLAKTTDWTFGKLLGVKPITEGMDATVNKVIQNIGNSTLSGLVRTTLVQPFSAWLTYIETGMKSTIGGLADAMSVSGWKTAKEGSSKIKLRTPDVSITESLERLSKAEGLTEKAIAASTEEGYKGIHYLDDFAAVWAWNAGKREGIKRGLSGKELNRFADDVLIKTQGSAAGGDRSLVQTHTLGKAASLFQTFNINQYSYFWHDVLGWRNPRISKSEAAWKTMQAVVSAAAVNSLMEYAGIPTPLPAPLSRGIKKLRESGSFPAAALEAGKEMAGLFPPLSGVRYTGGSPLGAVAQFGQDAFATLKGEPSRIPLWSLPLRLRGIPGTVQFERLSRVPGKLSLGEALFGKMQPDRPVSTVKKLSSKQVLEGQSYIKDLFPDLGLDF